MPLSNPLDILLTHDHWATKNILGACQKLPAEQFQRRFEMGPGSLHDTIAHIIGAMRGWTDLLAGRPMRPRPDQNGGKFTPDDLLKMLEESSDEFAHYVR